MSDEHFHLLTQAKWQNNANRDRDTASPLTGGLLRPCRSITHPEQPPRGHGPPLSLAREFLAWNTYFFTFHSLAGPYGHIKKYVSQAGSSVRTRTGLREVARHKLARFGVTCVLVSCMHAHLVKAGSRQGMLKSLKTLFILALLTPLPNRGKSRPRL